MKVFVTGATGFVGKVVVKQLLEQNHDILALSRQDNPFSGENVQVCKGDLLHLDTIKESIINFQPEVVMHLAWEGIPDFSPAMCHRNLNQAIGLFDFIAEQESVKKVIVAGSCAEYGDANGVCQEEQPSTANSYLSWVKNALYQYASLLFDQKKKECVWFRIFYVYGPGQREQSLIPFLINSFTQGTCPDIKTPSNANDFVYVDDVAQAFTDSVAQNIPSGIYNLGSGKALEVGSVCAIVEQCLNGSTDQSEQLKVQAQNNEARSFWADISKINKALGWQSKTSIEEGVKQHIASLQSL